MNPFVLALKNKKVRQEYAKSIVVGISSTALDFLITALFLFIVCNDLYPNFFAVLTSTQSPPSSAFVMATFLGWLIAFIVNYVFCVFFVYEYGNIGKTRKGFIKFAMFAAIGVTTTLLGSYIGVSLFNGNIWVVKIIVTLIVFVFNFFTRKYLVFNIALIRDDETTIRL